MTRRAALLLAILAFLAGGVAVVLPRIVDPDQFRPFISRTLELILGYPVSLAEVKFAPAEGLRLELRALEIKSSDPADPPLLRVEHTYLGLDWSFLLTSEIKVTSITLVEPQFNLVQHRDRALLRRAEEGAHQRNANMTRTLGLSLTNLSLKEIVVRDGLLHIRNQDHPEGHDWIVDQIQIQINNLSPHKASAINGSALVQSIPFTGHGQIGPLPESFNPLDMPLLLSVEAKSSRPDHLSAFLSKFHHNARADRGYFSTLIHGKLASGMRTNTALELFHLELSPSGKENLPARKKSGLQILPTLAQKAPSPPEQRNDSPLDARKESPLTTKREESAAAIDLSIRQKSIIVVNNTIPQATLQEFFVFLDESPLLELKGVARYDGGFDLNLDLSTMRPLAWEDIPGTLPPEVTVPKSTPLSLSLQPLALEKAPSPPSSPLVAQGSLEGNVHIQGLWPSAITVTGELDLTATDLLWRNFVHKPAGLPLLLNLNLSRQKANLSTTETTVQGKEQNLLSVQGHILPEPDLALIGTWEMRDLLALMPDLHQWSGDGLVAMDLRLTHPAESGWQLQGSLYGGESRLGPLTMESFTVPIHLTPAAWTATDMRLGVAHGNLDGQVFVSPWEPNPLFYAQWEMSGVSLERLLSPAPQERLSFIDRLEEAKAADTLQLEGLLFGHADVWGRLDKQLLPVESWGQANLRLEPGRLVGLDGAVLSHDLVDGQNLFQED
ncbi:MAG: hypothetical protein HQL62_03930, partial [Magnetococcales bacterium]|nr:hypothetical protein [Magnetococcales bacterium]